MRYRENRTSSSSPLFALSEMVIILYNPCKNENILAHFKLTPFPNNESTFRRRKWGLGAIIVNKICFPLRLSCPDMKCFMVGPSRGMTNPFQCDLCIDAPPGGEQCVKKVHTLIK